MSIDYGQPGTAAEWTALRARIAPTVGPILAMLEPDPEGGAVKTAEIVMRLERAVHTLATKAWLLRAPAVSPERPLLPEEEYAAACTDYALSGGV